MEISQLVNEAVKEQVSKAFQAELKRRKLNPENIVKKYFDSAAFKEMFDREIKKQAKEWMDNNDFFEDLPNELYKRIYKNAYKAIFK